MPEWTHEQLAAISARGSSILLSAAAGSGKTTVLVERVLRLIAGEGADVDRMLVVTFTRAAASDMRAKLSRQLNARAAKGDARCQEQLLRLDRASISTLHAFCADFLKQHFESAGVDPAFRILDDAVAERLRGEALDEAIEAAYAGTAAAAPEDADDGPVGAEPGSDVLALDYGRGPAGVRAAAEALFRRLEDRPDPEAWLERAVRVDDAALLIWQDELKDAARRSIASAMVQLREALNVPNCPIQYENAIRADLQALGALAALSDYDALYRGLSEFKAAPARGGKRSETDPDAADAVKRLRDGAKRALQDARIIQLPILTARDDMHRLADQLRTLAGIARRASELYEAKKAEQSGLTYADLEHKTLSALRRPETARAMREKYDYVFVDEYQDTSDLQEALIQCICRPDNRFMVGDVKQSIYRFRLAEPRLFMEKYDAYGRGEGGMLLPLTRNFRSRRGILDFVNMVFERAMTGGDSEITYDALARLNPGDADAPASETPDVDICLIDADAQDGDADDGAGNAPGAGEADPAIAELKGVEREGLFIARTIRQMMAADATLRFRDFAILTRSKAPAFDSIMPRLLSAGIPAYADGAAGYFESVEITWLLSMLRLIANGRLDVELIGALHSPAVGLSADELAQVRIAYRDMPYCDAARAYASERDDEIASKLRAFFSMIDGWRLRLGSMPLGEFTRMVLDDSGFYTYAGALPGGAQRQANLDQFVLTACAFDRESSGALTRFLQYTETMRQKGDGDAAHLLSENDNVVRMMTVHKSKGLEFRVVFGAQLSKKYRVEKTSAPLVAHRDLGVGMMYVDPELRTRRLTLSQAALIERGRREDAAEELRILYVMLTRARERLVLVGTVKGEARERRRWQALSAAPFMASSHLEVIMAARCGAEADGMALHSALRVIPAAEILPMDAAGEGGARAMPELPCTPAAERLSAEMAWRYPDPDAAKRPLKLTASGLLRELEGPEEIPPLAERPAFMLDAARRMNGAERGTAYHRSMQLIDLDALDGLSGAALVRAVEAQLDGFAARRLMLPAQREAVSPRVLARFLESAEGLSLRAAGNVRREWPFNLSLRAQEALMPEEAGRFGDAPILVQGTIDCCYEQDGRWVLLDYKTDRTEDLDALREHYCRQLGLYALALEHITHKPVARRVLCLIAQNKALEV